MPQAAVNGVGDDAMAPADIMEEALVWDTGLSQFLGRLEEDLIRWHSEERVKAKDREAKCLRAQQDATTAEVTIREAAAAQQLKGGEDQSWQDNVKELIVAAREQRDEMQQVCDLLRNHVKLHPLDASGIAATTLLTKLPSESNPFTAAGVELPKVTKLFLEFAEKQLVESGDGRHRQQGEGAGKEPKDHDKKKRKGISGAEKKSKKAKAHKAGKTRAVRSAEASSESDWSSSRSPSMNLRRRERRPRHRHTPSVDSRSLSDSRSCSKSRSRGYRGGCRGRSYRGRPPRRHDMGPGHKGGSGRFRGGKGGGGGPRPRGGGGACDDENIDLPVEIDRFCKVNKLESRCEKILRDLSPPLALHVMGFSGGSNMFELSGDVRNPTACVLARIRKAREDRTRGGGGRRGPPPGRHASRGRPPRSISSRSRSRHSRSPNGGVPDGGLGASGGPGGTSGHAGKSPGGPYGGSNAVPLGRLPELTPRDEVTPRLPDEV